MASRAGTRVPQCVQQVTDPMVEKYFEEEPDFEKLGSKKRETYLTEMYYAIIQSVDVKHKGVKKFYDKVKAAMAESGKALKESEYEVRRQIYDIYIFALIQCEFYEKEVYLALKFANAQLKKAYNHETSDEIRQRSFDYIGYVRAMGNAIVNQSDVVLFSKCDPLVHPERHGLTKKQLQVGLNLDETAEDGFDFYIGAIHDCSWDAHLNHNDETAILKALERDIETLKTHGDCPDIADAMHSTYAGLKTNSDRAANVLYDVVMHAKHLVDKRRVSTQISKKERKDVYQRNWPKVLRRSLNEYIERMDTLELLQANVEGQLNVCVGM